MTGSSSSEECSCHRANGPGVRPLGLACGGLVLHRPPERDRLGPKTLLVSRQPGKCPHSCTGHLPHLDPHPLCPRKSSVYGVCNPWPHFANVVGSLMKKDSLGCAPSPVFAQIVNHNPSIQYLSCDIGYSSDHRIPFCRDVMSLTSNALLLSVLARGMNWLQPPQDSALSYFS